MGYPDGTGDEAELFLRWLAFLRDAVLRKLEGLDEDQARWQPDGQLIPILGIVNHLTRVEWRWIDGAYLGGETTRNEAEFHLMEETARHADATRELLDGSTGT